MNDKIQPNHEYLYIFENSKNIIKNLIHLAMFCSLFCFSRYEPSSSLEYLVMYLTDLMNDFFNSQFCVPWLSGLSSFFESKDAGNVSRFSSPFAYLAVNLSFGVKKDMKILDIYIYIYDWIKIFFNSYK